MREPGNGRKKGEGRRETRDESWEKAKTKEREKKNGKNDLHFHAVIRKRRRRSLVTLTFESLKQAQSALAVSA